MRAPTYVKSNEGGAAPNHRVNPSARPVTSRAKGARAAPGRPAGYAGR